MKRSTSLRLLRIDLATHRTETEEWDGGLRRKFLGGRGINRWILLNEVERGTGALDPENKLIIGTGLFSGTDVPGACRLQVDTMSPYNGGVGSGNGGGCFAPMLKSAGWDHVIIEGASEKPVYIVIEDNDVFILDADKLWGRLTWETDETIREEHGRDTSVLCIGPAGENEVMCAGLFVDKYRAAARCGMGAVMGSKNLKAVAVRGSGKVFGGGADAFNEKCREMHGKIMESGAGKALAYGGTAAFNGLVNGLSWVPVRNFQDCHTDPENAEKLCVENWNTIVSRKIEDDAERCFGCPVNCSFFREITDGPYKGTVTANAQANMFWDFAFKFDIYDPAVTVKAQELCNQYGIDADSASGVVSWAYECYENGIIDSSDTDGLELKWGDGAAMLELLRKMAYREGFGDLLALGARKASEKIGRGSGKYCLHIKGQELKEPLRTMKGWALGVVVSPRAGTHTRGAIETEVMGVSAEDGEKYYGVPQAGDKTSYTGKAKIVVHTERLHALCDSLGLCSLLSEWMGNDLPGIMDYSQLCSSFLGETITYEELLETGERILTL
ncbi:MAG: hypothetical protein JXQ30_03285, partial [Spirochaetes bacterium]|nr:hypothetical protein [Spirochaetota bacterium]